MEEQITERNEILLPPWLKYPKIQRYSIGWRMGYGESYLSSWHTFIDSLSDDQKLHYFKNYIPIPVEWIDFISNVFIGKLSVSDDRKSEIYKKAQWLDSKGLIDYQVFYNWHQSYWNHMKT